MFVSPIQTSERCWVGLKNASQPWPVEKLDSSFALGQGWTRPESTPHPRMGSRRGLVFPASLSPEITLSHPPCTSLSHPHLSLPSTATASQRRPPPLDAGLCIPTPSSAFRCRPPPSMSAPTSRANPRPDTARTSHRLARALTVCKCTLPPIFPATATAHSNGERRPADAPSCLPSCPQRWLPRRS
jgi:hypothetical protein